MERSDMVIREIVSVYTNDLEWEHYQRKNRPYSGFCLKLTGSTIYHCDGKDYLSDNTHLIVIPQNTSYDYTILEKGKCVVVDFIADNDAVGIRSLRIRNSSLFKSIASSMQYAWSFKRVGYREICLSYAYQLLYQAVVCENEEYIASSLEKRIENGTLYLSQHYCDHALTIQKLAELSDTSEIYFRKLSTKIYGMSPKKYLLLMRIDRAKYLLETSDLAIRTISESVGYGDVYSFCKAFRKMVNCAPTEYRKRTK